MKKFMSKAMIIAMVAALAVGMTACSLAKNDTSEATTQTSQLVNPVREVSYDEVVEETGLLLPIPEGASDITYSIIDSQDGQMAEMSFLLDGKEWYLRAKTTDVKELVDSPSIDESRGDISGLCYEWDVAGTYLVVDKDTVFFVSEEGPGYIAWIDQNTSTLYNLCMLEGADQNQLTETAEKVITEENSEVSDNFSTVELASILDDIYATKAGSAGSGERVEAAAQRLLNFVKTYQGELSLEGAVDYVEAAMPMMENGKEDQNFQDNFKECFDAVVDAAESSDHDTAEMDEFKCIERAVELHFEAE